MANYQWQFNLETGTFKNQALSRDLYEAAVAVALFMDHVSPISAFGRKMGESVALHECNNHRVVGEQAVPSGRSSGISRTPRC